MMAGESTVACGCNRCCSAAGTIVAPNVVEAIFVGSVWTFELIEASAFKLMYSDNADRSGEALKCCRCSEAEYQVDPDRDFHVDKKVACLLTVVFVSEQTCTAGNQEATRYQSNGSCKYSYFCCACACVRERYVGDREW